MKTRLFISILLITGYLNVFSQSIKKAEKYLNDKEYEQAEEAYKKSIQKKKDVIVAKYGLGELYVNKEYDKYNIIKAYRYLKAASNAAGRLNKEEKEQLMADFNLSKKNIDKSLQEVVDKAYNNAKQANTIEAYNEFLTHFEDEKRIAYKVRQMRNKLAFKQAEETDTYKSYDYFVRQYPNADQSHEAAKRMRNMGEQFYELFTGDGEVRSLEEFDELYSFVQIPTEKKEKDKYWAKVGSKLDLVHGFDIDTMDWVSEMIKVDEFNNYITNARDTEVAFVALQRLIEPALLKKNYLAALDTIRGYRKYFKADNEKINQLIKTLMASDTVAIRSIGKNVNTTNDEYAPYITADGKQLYFCGKRRNDNLGGEDIFVSEFLDSVWSEAQLVGELCTRSHNEAPLSISTDGNTMFLFKNSNIYYTIKSENGWKKPEQVMMLNTETEWEADAILTADGKAMLFVSDRPGGVGLYRPINEMYHGTYNGNTDIYVTEKLPQGWKEPVNLGTTINTFYSERSPFLHPDMKTLYFSSEGHGGLGRLDIFKSTRLSDTSWTKWSEPVHLGRDVNTPKDDWGYRITTDGTKAYFALSENDNYDIAIFDLPIHLRPEMIATIEGKLTGTDKRSVTGKIIWEDLQAGKIVGEATINPATGKYFVTMPLGRKYGVYIQSDEFFPLSTFVDLTDTLKPVDMEFNLEVPTIEEVVSEGKTVKLNNLFFDHDKYELKPESYPELNRLLKFIDDYDVELIEIGGHTDNSGSEAYNKKLSNQRANAVKEYLMLHNCDAEKLKTVGYGASKPVSDNSTEEGRAKNRRVEIKILR